IDILPFEKTIIKTANELRIPTLTMIEGFLPIKQIKQDNLFIPFYAQKIALYTKAQKEIIMKKYKISEDRLIVTGYPLFDQYYNNKPSPKEIIYKRYNIPSNKKIVLYTAERYNKNKSKGSIWGAFTQKQCELIYRELFKSFKEFPELFLIIKKHPSGSLEDNEINKIADKLNFKNYIISRDMDICNLINASFAIITRQSNMGLEGMILGKYIIIMDTYFDTNDYFEYTKFNAALYAKKPGELKKALKSLIENKKLQEKLQNNIKKFISYNYSVNDGNSSERMAKLIQEITQKPYK
ncbi:MAG: CDP-glycerol glycerophosphotransferase family protein, partial [Nanoarchaeota archaeon]